MQLQKNESLKGLTTKKTRVVYYRYFFVSFNLYISVMG